MPANYVLDQSSVHKLTTFCKAHVAAALKLLRSALLGDVEQARPQSSSESDSEDDDDDDGSGGGATKSTPPRTPAKGNLMNFYFHQLFLSLHSKVVLRLQKRRQSLVQQNALLRA
jgi:hypothetical protein